ncbi:MAG TPA: threonine synthase [Puia sp.]|jgi:threonine synthase|nr:threonine synthase [Puia sp.]
MLFYNLNKPSEKVDFKAATIQGLGSEKGLFFPESIPVFPSSWINNLDKYSDEEIAWTVMKQYAGESIPEKTLRQITAETISFNIPLVPVSKNIYTLELFHGPTLAFKDVGARFMSRCLGYFMKGEDRPVTVLVATSGDTGGAVANGFLGVDGVNVIILYPSGKVSPVQELQLTTPGENISALEVEGSFDECQALVKQAFSDKELGEKIFLTSANSINVARWLPQQIYYFLAWKQWKNKLKPPVISVPSGNFGNICAGLLAFHSGLPVKHFIAACNINAVIPEYLKTGVYHPVKAKASLSNAMDVGDPSNFVRVLALFNSEFEPLKQTMSSESISDEETGAAIQTLYRDFGYQADPHGAVGWLALNRWLKNHPDQEGIFLETAHPVKFPDTVEKFSGKPVHIPDSVRALYSKKKTSVKIQADYNTFRKKLLEVK